MNFYEKNLESIEVLQVKITEHESIIQEVKAKLESIEKSLVSAFKSETENKNESN